MKPVRALSNQLSTLLAGDTATIGAAAANKVALINAPFVPGVNLLFADLSLSATAGLVPLAGVAGAQFESVDPVTGELIVEIKPPAGGFRWETQVGFTGPETIYGFALIDNGAANLWGTQSLPDPIVLTAPNESIIAPPIQFRIDPTKIT
jgi:hypothetical protein